MHAATLPSDRAFSPLRCYLLEARHEFLRLLRTPMFCIPTLVFPASFYVMFALALRHGANADAGAAAVRMLASYGVFGVMAPGLFGFGVSVATDRDRGWLRLRQALPMPPGSYLASKLAMAMLFAAMIALLLAALSIALCGVRLPLANGVALFVVEVLGVLPFCAIGLLIGSCVSAQVAPAIVNVIYLPMAFLSGLWVPLSMLPSVLRELAPVWPAWHLGQLAHAAVGDVADGAPMGHVVVLAIVTVVFLALARRRLARGQAS